MMDRRVNGIKSIQMIFATKYPECTSPFWHSTSPTPSQISPAASSPHPLPSSVSTSHLPSTTPLPPSLPIHQVFQSHLYATSKLLRPHPTAKTAQHTPDTPRPTPYNSDAGHTHIHRP
ncbi:hypothetical protein V6Z96_006572 [Aspergillus fumigatus]